MARGPRRRLWSLELTMSRAAFLTFTSVVALSVGLFALLAPSVLLGEVKHAAPSAAAEVMARTVGVLLVTVGALSFWVRRHAPSPTLRAVLGANLLLQLLILPIDPMAWHSGAFHTLGSFLPNTALHVLLASGFAYHLWRMRHL
jgi:hypothetical protein